MSDLKKMTKDEFNDLIRELDYDGRDAFVEVDFSNRDLTELDLQRIINKFVRCNFSGSDMTGVNMYEVEFSSCDFTNAKLDKAEVQRSQITQCNLSNASMIGTDFTLAFNPKIPLAISLYLNAIKIALRSNFRPSRGISDGHVVYALFKRNSQT